MIDLDFVRSPRTRQQLSCLQLLLIWEPFDVTEAPSCFGGGESPSVAGWADPLFSPAHIRTPLPFDASGTARVRERRRSRSAEALTSWTRLHRQAARGWRRRCPV
ncbi:hypothetical protein MTO96_014527 [Rhipicephalus appendiculatus]